MQGTTKDEIFDIFEHPDADLDLPTVVKVDDSVAAPRSVAPPARVRKRRCDCDSKLSRVC